MTKQPLDNIKDAAQGKLINLSNYQNAPGGQVKLQEKTIALLYELSKTYTFSVSELGGGSHSVGSKHYSGLAVDINIINGQQVSSTHPDLVSFWQDAAKIANKLGGNKILGPGSDANHATHFHIQFKK